MKKNAKEFIAYGKEHPEFINQLNKLEPEDMKKALEEAEFSFTREEYLAELGDCKLSDEEMNDVNGGFLFFRKKH